MSDTLYCVVCAMPQLELSPLAACKHCGSQAFTTALRLLNWEIALTWNDKKFLKSIKVKPD